MSKAVNGYKNIMIIGFGPHFEAVYLATIKNAILAGQLKNILVLDTEAGQERVQRVLAQTELDTVQSLFIPNKILDLEDVLEDFLDDHIESVADAVLISSEARSHKFYVNWALKRKMHVFVDKPLTVFDSLESDVYRDFIVIKRLAAQNGCRVHLCCERRKHQGYVYIQQLVCKIIDEYKVPITAINVSFAGGKLLKPKEYAELTNHPFNKGYGLLYHSGYHYVDLMMSFISLNKRIEPDVMRSLELHTSVRFPSAQTKFYEYSSLASQMRSEEPFVDNQHFINYGDIDLNAIGSFGVDAVPTTLFSLSLYNTSASDRDMSKDPEIFTRSIGRLRQEKVVLHLGHLLSIHVTSLPKQKLDPSFEPEFDIEMIASPHLKNMPRYRRINRKSLSELYPDLPQGSNLNRLSRVKQLKSFLNAEDSEDEFNTHGESIRLLQAISQQIYPYVKV